MVQPGMQKRNGKDATYLRKAALCTAQGANEELHVTVGERGHVDVLGVVRHDVRESETLMALGNLECFGFWLWVVKVDGWGMESEDGCVGKKGKGCSSKIQ